MDFNNAKYDYTDAKADYFNIRRSLDGGTLFSRETSLTLSILLPPTDWMRLETSYTAVTLSQTRSARRWNLSTGLTADIGKVVKQRDKGN